jgi:tetratricopeptide (TPR) repeat protein
MGHPTIADVQAELAASGRGLVVVGTGIAIAATAGTPQAALASWDGLLGHGLDYSVRFGRKDEAWAVSLRARLAPPLETEGLLAVAAEFGAALAAPGLGEFGRWLQDTVGSFRAAQRRELEALRDLGLPLATTNYDDLLEEITGLPAATWQDTAVLEDLLRGKPPRAILHLHGHWQRPDSVILDPAAYRRAAPVVQDLLKALRLSHTLLFVGCGEGLADPNWSALRDWSRDLLAASRWRHFRLCRTAELAELERQHPPAERLFPLPYGPDFSDFAPFLSRLRPAAAPSAPALPVASRCFGRHDEIEVLAAALCAMPPGPTAVLGPAGVGKTTLTLMALHHPRVAAHFGGRRYFARCAAATSRATLLNAIALSLGLDLSQAEQAADPEELVLYPLASAPALLVLDNAETPWWAESTGTAVGFEHLLTRLAALPGLALAVSLRGAERPFRLAWRETIALEQLTPKAAREAFLDVAGDAYRGDPHLDTLLAEVGHLPLAVVLLAAQAEGTPLTTVQNRWRQARTGMLQRPGADPREANLEASISLSVTSPRLTPDARRLAALLALLPDGMADDDLHALELEHGDDSSASLRKVGLALPRDPRLRLYPPIREVFNRTLPPATAEREHFVGHYLWLAKRGEKVGEEGGAEAALRLAPEIGNLEALLRSALKATDPRPAIEAALGVGALQRFTGLGGKAVLEQAVEVARRAGLAVLEGRLRKSLGDLAFDRNEHDTAQRCCEAALLLFRTAGDPEQGAYCIQRLGDIAFRRFKYDDASSRYKEALSLFQREHSRRGEASATRRLGDIALALWDYDGARSRYEEALRLYRLVRSPLGEANCIRRLGTIALALADHDGARRHFEKAIPVYHRVGTLLGEAQCIKGFGDIALARSDLTDAEARYGEALPLYRRVGNLLGEAHCNQGFGDIALVRSDHDSARSRYENALALYSRAGNLVGEADCTQRFGDIALARNDHELAHTCYEQARRLFGRVGHLLGEATCIRGLGDLSLRAGDEAGARDRFQQALDLYARIPNRYSIGWTHRLLAWLARGDSGHREPHLSAARAAWQAIQRPDLIADLDREFPPGES